MLLCHDLSPSGRQSSLLNSCWLYRSAKDRSLHDLISADILPKLRESAAIRKRAEEKQAAIEAMPKKRSSRLQVKDRLLLCKRSTSS